MDVSVIVPTLNEEKCIEDCLGAIRSQKTKLRYEVIVCDGHSKDRTREIARKYADKVVYETHPSISGGRNGGAEAAKGEILVFIDADTLIPSDYLQTVWDYFRKDKDVVALGGVTEYTTGSLIIKIDSVLQNLGAWWDQVIIGTNFCVRKSIFKKSGGFPYIGGEDIAYSKTLKKYGKVVFLNSLRTRTSSRRPKDMGVFGTQLYYAKLSKCEEYEPKR